jgi:hypothetical protein
MGSKDSIGTRICCWLLVFASTWMAGCKTIGGFLKGDSGKGGDTVPYLAVMGAAVVLCLGANFAMMRSSRRTRANEILNAIFLILFFLVAAAGLVLFAMAGQGPEL